MKERPISFNDEMVRAVFDGRKTQTRRTKKLKKINENPDHWQYQGLNVQNDHLFYATCTDPDTKKHQCEGAIVIKSPYGIPGDRLNPVNCSRWASLILLEVTNIRVERVQDISEPDALAEGVKSTAVVNEAGDDYTGSYASEHYIGLWNSINEKKGFGWDMNPWVWVVEFKVI